MQINYPAHSFITHFFQDFYHELLRQKERALRLSEAPNSHSTSESLYQLVKDIQRSLSLLLEEQSLSASKQVGEFAASHYQEAQYAMVALADETFLSLPWFGKEIWKNTMLEVQIFHTQVAGELIFKRLDALLEGNDPARSDLAIVYLLILGLGFKGKFGEVGDEGKIDWYRAQLFQFINRKPATLFNQGREFLMEECYAHKLTDLPGKGLPDVRSWSWAFVGVLTSYLFVTYVLWYTLVRDIDTAINGILSHARELPLS